jgi:hypothetical protein
VTAIDDEIAVKKYRERRSSQRWSGGDEIIPPVVENVLWK